MRPNLLDLDSVSMIRCQLRCIISSLCCAIVGASASRRTEVALCVVLICAVSISPVEKSRRCACILPRQVRCLSLTFVKLSFVSIMSSTRPSFSRVANWFSQHKVLLERIYKDFFIQAHHATCLPRTAHAVKAKIPRERLTTMLVMPRLIGSTILLAAFAAADVYTLKDDLTSTPSHFYNSFNFFTGDDPTEGYVNYVDRHVAAKASLIGYNSTASFDAPAKSILLGANHKHHVSNPRGRSSVRLSSRKTYDAGTLFVADIAHMPTTCGARSALWLLGDGVWPENGEVDWIEGGNALAPANLISLHTTSGCVLSTAQTSKYTGVLQQNVNCDVKASVDNSGCTIAAKDGSFGPSFNRGGGGIYVLEWVKEGFNVWFFPRHGHLPKSLRSKRPDTAEFGKPVAQFAGAGCDWKARFKKMRIIINTTFCGGWGNAVWGNGGCAAKTGVPTCSAFVKDHPKAFEKAYWEINGLRTYRTTKK